MFFMTKKMQQTIVAMPKKGVLFLEVVAHYEQNSKLFDNPSSYTKIKYMFAILSPTFNFRFLAI